GRTSSTIGPLREQRMVFVTDPAPLTWMTSSRCCAGSHRPSYRKQFGWAGWAGRNERVAWGCTNNICSQRDLYQEKTDPAQDAAKLDATVPGKQFGWAGWAGRNEGDHG